MPNRRSRKAKRNTLTGYDRNQAGYERMRNTLPSPWSLVASTVPLFAISPKQIRQRYYDYGKTIVVAAPGGIQQHFFSANGLYDPDITGTGHQPIGFDQMMLMYEQYVVLRSRISVTFVTQTAVQSRVGIYLSPDAVALGAVQMVENGQMVSTVIDGGVVSGSGGSGERMRTLEYEVDVPQYFGRPNGRSIANDPDLTGGVASNPGEQVYYGVCCWSMTGTDSPSVAFDVLITYDVIYTEPKKLASS